MFNFLMKVASVGLATSGAYFSAKNNYPKLLIEQKKHNFKLAGMLECLDTKERNEL